MPILNPIHLLDQAERLSQAPLAGPPRQVDLRRAISSAYYALFHLLLTALSDEFVGVAHRATSRYALMHRSIDHRSIRDLCSVVIKQRPPVKYGPFVPPSGFGPDLSDFARAVIDLQERRHAADYDVGTRYRAADARRAISEARIAVLRFEASGAAERRLFLTLLLCPPR